MSDFVNDKVIKKEDYDEPVCPLCMPSDVTPIPLRRVFEKLDEYFAQKDFDAAERHLKYWLDDADAGNDMRGKLSVLNEQIGLYRKWGREAEALEASEAAIALALEIGLSDTVTMGTTLVNAATAYKAFEHAEKAMPLYEKAAVIYEAQLDGDDSRLGGLYNNMALAVAQLGDFERAESLYYKAISVMSKVPNGELETAITYCNLADLVASRLGIEDGEKSINAYLEKAMELLNTESLRRDGYYAFVCEKCAPTFGYYGFFLYEKDLNTRAEKIYERA